VALVWLWGGFVFRSLCLVYAYNMALGWLWVASPRLKRSGPSSEGEPVFAEVRFRADCGVGGESVGRADQEVEAGQPGIISRS
jgi:hypothetical protein